ncbi:MAG: YncE family protein [Bacteroidia bacterium]|nr:YncE family protein [Bacteroidia bacterium]
MKDDSWTGSQSIALANKGLFIVNEGNFMYGNASLSYYDPATKQVQLDLFYKINGLPLGDVAQSMTIYKNLGFISINNSGKIYVIDSRTGKYVQKITGLVSPRNIFFSTNGNGYITDLYAGKISILNPQNFQITGSIRTPGHPSTEQMVEINDRLYVSCWSFDNTILVIDTKLNQVVDSIKVGIQPAGLALDKLNKLWVLFQLIIHIEKSFSLASDATPSRLAINGTKDTLVYLSSGVWKQPIVQETLNIKPFINQDKHLFYSLGVDPQNSELYIGDAIDYQQQGVIYRYSNYGAKLDSFKTGIIPGSFCFK